MKKEKRGLVFWGIVILILSVLAFFINSVTTGNVIYDGSIFSGKINAGLVFQDGNLIGDIFENKNNLEKYEKYEVMFNVDGGMYSDLNVFDPGEINVEMLLTTPSGKNEIVPGFYYRDYSYVGIQNGFVSYDPVHGSDKWMVRYAPREAGIHKYVIKVDKQGLTETTSEISFSVSEDLNSNGFVRAKNYTFVFDDGTWFFPIGATTQWGGVGFSGSEGLDSFIGINHFTNLSTEKGGNFNRLWIDTGSWNHPSLEVGVSYWNLFYNPSVDAEPRITNGEQYEGRNSLRIKYPVYDGSGNLLTSNFAGNPTKTNSWVPQRKIDWRMTQGKEYRLGICFKADNVTGNAYIKLQQTNIKIDSNLQGTQDWTCRTTNFNWGNTWSRVIPEVGVENFSGTIYLDNITLIELDSGRNYAFEGDFEKWVDWPDRYEINKINLDDAYFLDEIISHAEEKEMYIQLMMRACGTLDQNHPSIPYYQNYIRYLVARYGYSPNVFSWEICNERPSGGTTGVQYYQNMSDYIAGIDPYEHLITTSAWSGVVDAGAISLGNITLANVHHYPKDVVSVSLWGMNPETDLRVDKNTAHTGERSIKLNSTDSRSLPGTAKVDLNGGESYTISVWFKGESVVRGGNYPRILIREFDNFGNSIGFGDYVWASPLGDSGSATLDWFKKSKTITASQGTRYWTIEINHEGISAGNVWFDDIEIRNSQNEIVYLEGFEGSGQRVENMAHIAYNMAKTYRSYNFQKPVIGGEYGIENETGYFIRSPYSYSNQDPDGIHFHNWLWGFTFGGVSGATGMWWYDVEFIDHQVALSEFIKYVNRDFVESEASVSNEINSFTSTSNSKLYSFSKRNSEKNTTYIFLKNAEHSIFNLARDGGSLSPISEGEEVIVRGMKNGTYSAQWFNTYYLGNGNPIYYTQEIIVDDGELKFNLIDELYTDTAVIIKLVSEELECTDSDLDGYYKEAGCGTLIDCNDEDSGIHPGAEEIECNGIDESCDGIDACLIQEFRIESNSFDGRTTNFSLTDLSAPFDLILEKSVFGIISFNDQINFSSRPSGTLKLDEVANITEREVEIKTTNVPELNVSANITLYNIENKSEGIKILRDSEECIFPDCEFIVLTSEGDYTFRVKHFTKYSLSYCGDEKVEFGEECDGNNFGGKTCASFGYNDGSLKCNTCIIDKSGCSVGEASSSGGGGGTQSIQVQEPIQGISTGVCRNGDYRSCGSSLGVCKQGVQSCVNGRWGGCVGEIKPSTEICDGLDNNCNGEIDEGLNCACTPGERITCGSNEGICKEGFTICGEDRTWGACQDEIGPIVEICGNQKDDNCNGVVDESDCLDRCGLFSSSPCVCGVSVFKGGLCVVRVGIPSWSVGIFLILLIGTFGIIVWKSMNRNRFEPYSN